MQISGGSLPFLAFSTKVVIEAVVVLTLPVYLPSPCTALPVASLIMSGCVVNGFGGVVESSFKKN